jgi:hypothetical protein
MNSASVKICSLVCRDTEAFGAHHSQQFLKPTAFLKLLKTKRKLVQEYVDRVNVALMEEMLPHF